MRLCRAGTHRARPDGARCRRGGGIDSRPSARGHPTWGTSMTVTSVDDLKIKIFADGADLDGMKAMAAKPWIKGLTTNPTLMRKAGITDYAAFARRVLDAIPDKPRSEEHTSELQSLMRISYAVFCLKKKTHNKTTQQIAHRQQVNQNI